MVGENFEIQLNEKPKNGVVGVYAKVMVKVWHHPLIILINPGNGFIHIHIHHTSKMFFWAFFITQF